MDYENQIISLHLTGYGDAEVKVSDLTDDQLKELWRDAKVEVARWAYRERTGRDPAKSVFDLTGKDAVWRIEWKKRQEAKKAAETTND